MSFPYGVNSFFLLPFRFCRADVLLVASDLSWPELKKMRSIKIFMFFLFFNIISRKFVLCAGVRAWDFLGSGAMERERSARALHTKWPLVTSPSFIQGANQNWKFAWFIIRCGWKVVKAKWNISSLKIFEYFRTICFIFQHSGSSHLFFLKGLKCTQSNDFVKFKRKMFQPKGRMSSNGFGGKSGNFLVQQNISNFGRDWLIPRLPQCPISLTP